MFYIQFSLARNIDCALFLQRVEKARSESSAQRRNVNRIKQERDYTTNAKRFIFIHQTITLKQHNQHNLIVYFCNLSFYSFSSKTHHFLNHSQLLCATNPLFIANSLIAIHSFSHIFLIAKALLLQYNSYAFTLQYHSFYNLKAMLSPFKVITPPTSFHHTSPIKAIG